MRLILTLSKIVFADVDRRFQLDGCHAARQRRADEVQPRYQRVIFKLLGVVYFLRLKYYLSIPILPCIGYIILLAAVIGL